MLSKVFPSFKNCKNLGYLSKRFFDLHEYQSKDIMRKYNVRVQKGAIAQSAEDAKKIAEKLDPAGGLILKAQVHAGGRGKGTYLFMNVDLYLKYRNLEQWSQGRCQDLQDSSRNRRLY